MLMSETLLIILILALLGLCFGSFVNALVFRLRKAEEPAVISIGNKLRALLRRLMTFDFKQAPAKNRYSMWTGRSMCSRCEHPLAVQDLVPLFSWLALGGKCRYCKKPIKDSPIVEAILPVVFVVSYLYWPQPLTEWYQLFGFVSFLAGVVGLAALFIYDVRWYLLPDKIIWPLVAIAGVNALVQAVAVQPQGDILGSILFYLYGLLPIAGLYWLIYTFSKGRMVGLGDVKLGLFIGLSLGWPGALATLFLANLLGALYAAPLMLTGKLKRDSRIPFGPFLIIAYFIAAIWGGAIISWYTGGLL